MITVTSHAKDGWQLFRAADSEISAGNEGPFGFGRTPEEAKKDLERDEYYRAALKASAK